ncbi:MAG TPA: phosphopentomutase [candidate division Zixibacteria bacterium]|nr:phosphopentomutase [candidate division Zixibacteria bacterium]
MRACVLILDSCGVGELPDAADYGDKGSNTIGNVARMLGGLNMPNLQKMGLGNIIDIEGVPPAANPMMSYGKMAQGSAGKDSTVGHWEHFGIITKQPFPTYPNGFPPEIISEFEKRTGRKAIGNKPASGTEIIKELGEEHLKTGALIVYTSADSVFQIAAHRRIVPVEELYRYSRIAREIMSGKHGVSRIIARPFDGEPGSFYRTEERHDFSLAPTSETGLDILSKAGHAVISIGKINDLFAGSGITENHPTKSNANGVDTLIEILGKSFDGLVYINLVDFDMLWGHRNDVRNFAGGLEYFDTRFPEIKAKLSSKDLFIISADHGCDPTTPSTDHSREYVPILAGLGMARQSKSLEIRKSFADLGATVLDLFGLHQPMGESFLGDLK